ncbi:hypothetical protein ACFLVX_03155 [Chloroflexota bacterium]
MRTLSGTLTAAQKSLSRHPYFRVKVTDRISSRPRISWSRLYTGSEDLYGHDACFAGDGSLQRVRIDPSGYTIRRQRVASPGPSPDFSVWTFYRPDLSGCGHLALDEPVRRPTGRSLPYHGREGGGIPQVVH